MDDELKTLFGGSINREESSSIEKTLDNIAERLSYREILEQLMQMSRVTYEERRTFAILYAFNRVKLIRSNTLTDYLFASLSLSVSVKGKSREEVLEMGKASMSQIPAKIMERMRSKMGFE